MINDLMPMTYPILIGIVNVVGMKILASMENVKIPIVFPMQMALALITIVTPGLCRMKMKILSIVKSVAVRSIDSYRRQHWTII